MPWFLGPLLALPLALWLGGWIWLAHRQAARWFPPRPRRPVPWHGAELMMLIGIMLSAAILTPELASLLRAGEAPPGRLDAPLLFSFSLLQLLGLGLLLAWLSLARRASLVDLGLGVRRIAEDLLLGLLAFVVVGPPVYAVQFLLTQLFPTEHPLLLLLQREPTFANWLLAGFTALVAAPLVEELYYRVVLQGWLEKVLAPEDAGSEPKEGATPVADRGGRLAILISAALFAAMHVGHGPDPIPLFLLALAFGWLYRQTHCLLPSLVLHFLLNATSLGLMCLHLHTS